MCLVAEQIQRRRKRLGTAERTCSICGHRGLELVQTERVREGRALVRFWEGRHVRRYTCCPACGAREEVDVGGRHSA